MTKEEFLQKKKVLIANHELEIKKLEKEFVILNNPYKAGDIISDGWETIIIEKIRLGRGYFNEVPECVYTGFLLTKKGVRRTDNKKATIYQSDIDNHKKQKP